MREAGLSVAILASAFLLIYAAFAEQYEHRWRYVIASACLVGSSASTLGLVYRKRRKMAAATVGGGEVSLPDACSH